VGFQSENVDTPVHPSQPHHSNNSYLSFEAVLCLAALGDAMGRTEQRPPRLGGFSRTISTPPKGTQKMNCLETQTSGKPSMAFFSPLSCFEDREKEGLEQIEVVY
jgi:hypothetical protein